jgi:endosialidase-like protein
MVDRMKTLLSFLIASRLALASYYPLPTSAVVVGSDADNQPLAATTTGTGTTVDLQTSPALTTPSFATAYGGSAVGSTMSLQGTSSGSPSAAYLFLQPNAQFTQVGSSVVPAAQLEINGNTVASPGTLGTSPILHIVGANATQPGVMIDAFGSATTTLFTVRAAGGTAASPAALAPPSDIFQFTGYGWDGSGNWANSVALEFIPTQTWTSTAHGTRMIFEITPNNSTTITGKLVLDQDGQLYATNLVNSTAATTGTLCYTTPGSGPFHGLINYDGTNTCLVSSRRFKHSIRPLRLSGLSLVDRFRPVSFRYNHEPETPHYGLIAEDVARIDPTLVGFKENLPYSLREMDIVAVMIRAIQELSAKVNRLERRAQ